MALLRTRGFLRSWKTAAVLGLGLVASGVGVARSAHAEMSPAPFLKRFELQADKAGELDAILIKKQTRITIMAVINELKKDLEIFQLAARTGEVQEWMDGEDAVEWPAEYRGAIEKSLKALETFDAEQAFSDEKVRGIFDIFDRELQKILDHFRLVAKPGDSSYFYKQALLKKAVETVLDIAKKQLGNLPILNLVSFVIDRGSTMIDQRRNFYQYMTLNYTQHFYAKDVGMNSSITVGKVKSSIYESRLSWNSVLEHKKAVDQWVYYGADHFNAEATLATLLLTLNQKRYDEIGTRMNFLFQEVTEKGVHKIVNLGDRKSMFSIKPSDAYFFDNPRKVEKQRRMIRLVQMGLRLVNIPAFIAGWADRYLDSMYVNQVQTEGALFGYMESMGMSAELDVLTNQTINPLMGL